MVSQANRPSARTRWNVRTGTRCVLPNGSVSGRREMSKWWSSYWNRMQSKIKGWSWIECLLHPLLTFILSCKDLQPSVNGLCYPWPYFKNSSSIGLIKRQTTNLTWNFRVLNYIPGPPVKKPIRKYAHGRIIGKRAPKYAQGVFYRSLSRAVTGVYREIIKQSFQVCGISAKGLAVPMEHFDCLSSRNSRLPGGWKWYSFNEAFEDKAGDEFDRE